MAGCLQLWLPTLLSRSQLDHVAVWILYERDNVRAAVLQRSGGARNFDAFCGELLSEAIQIRHCNCDMAVSRADRIAVVLTPIVGQLERVMLLFALIADEHD